MSLVNPSNSDDHLIRRRPTTVEPSEWFYEIEGRSFGPFSSAEILAKIRSGEVHKDTPVRKDDSQWVPASEVNGLLEAAQRSASYFKCPYCGARVDKPPTVCLSCDREVTAVYRVREKTASPPAQPTAATKNAKPGPSKGQPDVPSPAPATRPAASNGESRDDRAPHSVFGRFRAWWRA